MARSAISARTVLLLYAIHAIALCSAAFAAIDTTFTEKVELLQEQFLDSGLDEDYVARVFEDDRVTLYPEIVSRTGKGFNYLARRFGLLSRSSIKRGQDILRQKKALFDGIERQFGVNREIIVAVLRIETNFGTSTGKQSIFNSLLTFAVVENRRTGWAQEELIHLLRLCQENNLDPLDIKGSWAGAFGLAQFIPSSYVKYAVDGDKDGRIDLFRFDDAASSIANYLKSHGWDRKQNERNREAVWSYNHCDSYVKAAFTYAAALKHPPSATRRRR